VSLWFIVLGVVLRILGGKEEGSGYGIHLHTNSTEEKCVLIWTQEKLVRDHSIDLKGLDMHALTTNYCQMKPMVCSESYQYLIDEYSEGSTMKTLKGHIIKCWMCTHWYV